MLLYGISLVYGFSGTMDFKALHMALMTPAAAPPGLVVGIVFVLVGLAGTSLRWGLAAWAPGFQVFLISQTLHGLMVAGVFTGQSLLLARLLPADRLASGSAAAALVNGGIMSVAGSALSGWIWQMAGLRAVCWTTSGVAALALLYFWRYGPDPEP